MKEYSIIEKMTKVTFTNYIIKADTEEEALAISKLAFKKDSLVSEVMAGPSDITTTYISEGEVG